MKTKIKILYGILIVTILVLSGANIFAQKNEESTTECCFTREGYQGVCKITPGEDESCESILKYLNTAGTTGKTYCGGSKLRGGWKQVKCEKAEE